MKLSIVISVVLAALYALFLAYGPQPAKFIAQNQWQDNQIIVGEYLQAKNVAPVVIVGSSLADRLVFQGNNCIYNLALSGDSALTGLDAILISKKYPKSVFIEINVAERVGNPELIEKSDGFLKRLSPIFYVKNMPVNLLYSFLSEYKTASPEISMSNAAFQGNLELQSRDYNHPVDLPQFRSQMNLYREKVGALEKRGVHVIFFELPVFPSLEKMAKAVQIRSAFLTEFPNNTLIRYDELSQGIDMHTWDALHMTATESDAVSRRLSSYFDAICKTPKGVLSPG